MGREASAQPRLVGLKRTPLGAIASHHTAYTPLIFHTFSPFTLAVESDMWRRLRCRAVAWSSLLVIIASITGIVLLGLRPSFEARYTYYPEDGGVGVPIAFQVHLPHFSVSARLAAISDSNHQYWPIRIDSSAQHHGAMPPPPHLLLSLPCSAHGEPRHPSTTPLPSTLHWGR